MRNQCIPEHTVSVLIAEKINIFFDVGTLRPKGYPFFIANYNSFPRDCNKSKK